jgi:hypothetical protein
MIDDMEFTNNDENLLSCILLNKKMILLSLTYIEVK